MAIITLRTAAATLETDIDNSLRSAQSTQQCHHSTNLLSKTAPGKEASDRSIDEGDTTDRQPKQPKTVKIISANIHPLRPKA